MDAESQYFSLESPFLADRSPQNGNSFHRFSPSGAQCLLCRRAFSLEAEVNDGFEAIHICRECKLMVLDDNQTNLNIRDIRHLRRQRRGRFRSSEPMADSFYRRFSQLINLANHNDETQLGGDTPVTQRRVSYYTARSRSQRRRSTLSDNDSDAFDQPDSVFGETDSNFSFGGYRGESDASLDGHSLVDIDTFLQLENESYASTDTDIDPMHAGLDQWNSDGQEDGEDGEWEEADWVEANRFVEQHQQFQDANISPGVNGTGGAQHGTWFQLRVGETGVQYTDVFAGLEDSDFRPAYVGNPGDYVDARGFEELLEQLAEIDNSRRGAPPAAASSVRILPSVVISKDHEKNGFLICAVCKDLLLVNAEAKQLPCMHLYHPSCILPWLNVRNSCPVCRHELPSDDQEYEEAKRNLNRNGRHEPRALEAYDTFTELETDEAHAISDTRAEHGSLEGDHHVANRSSRVGNRGGWLFLAAVPIVSIVGIVLVYWLRKPAGDGRIRDSFSEQHLRRTRSTTSPADRNRRWWSIF